MTLLLDPSAVSARRTIAAGGLRPLADSLAADLEAVAAREVWLPPEKARLTRRGGWCPRDGSKLDFDPEAPHEHRCPRCGGVFDGDDHYRWWIVGYQLWLAERAVHGAALALVAGRDELGAFADRVLAACADAYLAYPNADNVLGPTRPFFSTYLESIWLLQLCVAQSLREAAGAWDGGALRERVVEPSARLIASYDEGASNRQVWNDAALLAAGASLGTAAYDRALDGPSGLLAHLGGGLLADGSWYEGENYHLFAHRGLWYGATLAARRGAVLPAELTRRLDLGFVTPFLTALPDYTFPARRDSAYAVSLRQWRFAELAELGLARGDSPELLGALRTLYDPSVPRTGTERPRSTAETERNAPASGLTRADLGWRALLFARESLPVAGAWAPGSVLLPEQGIAVLRRASGARYVALDYGRSGGGHGHPDRLNVLLSEGAARWQDDVGTGSYTERTLHWYRSTLAHGAPLVDGRSQPRVDGALLAFDERGDYGLVAASAAVADGVHAERTVVAAPGYTVVLLEWRSDGPARTVDLPIHCDGEVAGATWRPSTLVGGVDPEDGFPFLVGAERDDVAAAATWRLDAQVDGARARLWCASTLPTERWRAWAPGPPGEGEGRPRRLHLVRAAGVAGRTVQLWSTAGEVEDVLAVEDRVVVRLVGGTVETHEIGGGSWRVRRRASSAASRGTADATGDVTCGAGSDARLRARPGPSGDAGDDGGDGPVIVELARARPGAPPRHEHRPDAAVPPNPFTAPTTTAPPRALGRSPLVARLGADHYRRSELSWLEAGSPRADVALAVVDRALVVDLRVTKRDPVHAPPAVAENPLDNEHPATNADSVQLHVAIPGPGGERELAWIVVPAAGGARVDALTPAASAAVLGARWEPVAGGYAMRLALALPPDVRALALDVAINETSPARERRRGQLVLSGGAGDWVYLRGARLPRSRFLTFSVPHV